MKIPFRKSNKKCVVPLVIKIKKLQGQKEAFSNVLPSSQLLFKQHHVQSLKLRNDLLSKIIVKINYDFK